MDLSSRVVDDIIQRALTLAQERSAMHSFAKQLWPQPLPQPLPLEPPRSDISYLPHQIHGIRWMLDRESSEARFCRGGILADDMGLGKTFQTIGLIKNSPPCNTLILCPPVLISAWTQELAACNISFVTVASYHTAHYRVHDFIAQRFQRVILDEGHCIRNGKATKRWRTCRAIAKSSSFRWILSATPVQNGSSDWINLCIWLKTKATLSQIHDIAPFILLRRTMDDLRPSPSVPPPPVFFHHTLSIPPSSPEGVLFRSLADNLDSSLDSPHISSFLVLELYLRIQQFLVHPQIYIQSMRTKFNGSFVRPDWSHSATKFETFLRVLQESFEPTVVFCQFNAEMDLVASQASSLGWNLFFVRGGVSSSQVSQSISLARSSPLRSLFIVQIVSGGAGLNLQFCSRILFLSQHWNPAVVHQACGRSVRIGQSSPVSIHFFSIDDPVAINIDRRMNLLHSSKISEAKSISSSFFSGFPSLSSV